MRHLVGDLNELEGLRGEHVLMLDDEKKFAITKSEPMIARALARLVNTSTIVP